MAFKKIPIYILVQKVNDISYKEIRRIRGSNAIKKLKLLKETYTKVYKKKYEIWGPIYK